MSNQILPDDVLKHCQKYQGCEGCPLKGSCAPPEKVTQEWLDSRVIAIRELNNYEVDQNADCSV